MSELQYPILTKINEIRRMDRRSFLGFFQSCLIAPAVLEQVGQEGNDRKYWRNLRKHYPIAASRMMNLNNGSVGTVCLPVEEKWFENIKKMNRQAPYEFEKHVGQRFVEKSLQSISKMIDCDQECLVLNRNATEGLTNIIEGVKLKKGSNVVAASFDYPYSINALKHKCKRERLEFRSLDITLPMSDDEILNAYSTKIDEKTSFVLITAVTHREGALLPVKKLVNLCKENGAYSCVDAAQLIGQFSHSVKHYDCDFYAASLHKWVSAPIGTGIMYVKKEKLKDVRGVFASYEKDENSYVKYKHLGTRNFASEASVYSALLWHDAIGTDRKLKRLQYLQKYWQEKLDESGPFKILENEHANGLAALYSDGQSVVQLKKHLARNNIHTKVVKQLSNNRNLLRISPNVYHNEKDLDKFVDAIKDYKLK